MSSINTQIQGHSSFSSAAQTLPSLSSLPNTMFPFTSNGSSPIQASESFTQGRAYRSRKHRPCDGCRKRKGRCIIEEAGQDCQACRLNNRTCTFEMSPTPRSRPIKNEDGTGVVSTTNPRKRSQSAMHHSDSTSPNGTPTKHYLETGPSVLERPTSSQELKTSQRGEGAWRSENLIPLEQTGVKTFPITTQYRKVSIHEGQNESKATADDLFGLISNVVSGRDDDLEAQVEPYRQDNQMDRNEHVPEEEKGMMPVVLGSSSSEDPMLLRQAGSPTTSRPEASPGNDQQSSSSSRTNMQPLRTPETSSTSAAGSPFGPLHVRQVASDPHHPIFFAFVPSHPYGKSKGKGREIGAQGLAKLKSSLPDKIGRLMVLYSQRDSTAFPLLMETQRRKFRQAAAVAMEACRNTHGGVNVDIPLPAVLANATLATATVYDSNLRSVSKQAWGANLQALTEQFDIS